MGMRWAILCGVVAAAAAGLGRAAETFQVARNGKPAASIVIAQNPTRAAEFAAEELQSHLKQITGATLPVVDDSQPVEGPAILVGRSRLTEAANIRPETFEAQQYLVRITPRQIILLGKDQVLERNSSPKVDQDPVRVPGRSGSALQFNGINDVFHVPDPGLNLEQGTLEAWVDFPAAPQSYGAVVMGVMGTYQHGSFIIEATNERRVRVRYDGMPKNGLLGPYVTPGWHHVMATYSKPQKLARLIIDGKVVAEGPYDKHNPIALQPLVIGGVPRTVWDNAFPLRTFNGTIDEVRVSSIAREPGTPATSASADEHTQLLLTFDEAKGTSRDSSGHHRLVNPPRYFDEIGTLYAVYDFLEKQCGVRWYAPYDLGTVIPSNPSLALAPVDIQRKPAMNFRWMGTVTPFHLASDAPEAQIPTKANYQRSGVWRISEQDAALWRLRLRIGGAPMSANHAFNGWRPRFEKDHPEYFAQGQPPHRHRWLDFLNTEVQRQILQDARAYFDDQPVDDPAMKSMGDFFSVVPMDSNLWGKDPATQALIDTEEQKTNKLFMRSVASRYVWTWTNMLARELARTHPDKHLLQLAYADYAGYPGFPIEKNVAVMLTLSPRMRYTAAMAEMDDRLLREWSEKHEPLYVWVWYCFPALKGRTDNFNIFPGYITSRIPAMMQQYHAAKVRGMQLQTGSEFGASHIMDQPDLYLTWRLADDPTLDGRKMIEEFFALYYGPAAKPMRQLYAALEETYNDPGNWPQKVRESRGLEHITLDAAWGSLGTAERMEQFGKFMEAAIAAANQDPYRARVALFKKNVWDYMVAGKEAYERRNQADANLPRVRVPKLATSTNGDVARVDWSKAATLGPLVQTETGAAAARAITGSVVHDGQYVYLRLIDPIATAKLQRDPAQAKQLDNWEIFLAPQRLSKPYYQMIITADGASRRLGYEVIQDTEWKIAADVRMEQTPEGWAVMVALPADALGVSSGGRIFANVFRTGISRGEKLAWVPTFSPGYHALAKLAEWSFE